MRTACHDQPHEDRLTHDGFAIVALLDPDELARIRRDVRDLGFGADDGTGFPVPRSRMRISISQGDAETSARIFDALAPLLREATCRILREYALLRIGIFDKLPRGAAIEPHQHATIVDESKYRSLTMWVPLGDTTVEMGTLHVVPASHDLTHDLRPKNHVRDRFARVSRKVVARHSTPVALGAGEAVVFDDRLIHWSPPNRSSRIRTALQLELVPEEAELVMYYQAGALDLAKYAVERSEYRRSWLNLEDPQKLRHLETLSQPVVRYGARHFRSMLGGARAPESFLSRIVAEVRNQVGF
jgi:hypothetical protein